MSLRVAIEDGDKNQATVIDGGLSVSVIPAPATSAKNLYLSNVQILTVNGDGISGELNLDGSVDPIEAYVEASQNEDTYFKKLTVLISDTLGGQGIVLSDFGGIPALTNGITLYIESENIKYPITPRPLKTNFEVLRLGTRSPTFGVDDTAYRIKGAKTGNDYDYFAIIDLTDMSPQGLGVRLAAGTKQRLGIIIQDDLTELSAFEIVSLGYRRFV